MDKSLFNRREMLKVGALGGLSLSQYFRARANSEAQRGIYAGSGKEGAAASTSLQVDGYVY